MVRPQRAADVAVVADQKWKVSVGASSHRWAPSPYAFALQRATSRYVLVSFQSDATIIRHRRRHQRAARQNGALKRRVRVRVELRIATGALHSRKSRVQLMCVSSGTDRCGRSRPIRRAIARRVAVDARARGAYRRAATALCRKNITRTLRIGSSALGVQDRRRENGRYWWAKFGAVACLTTGCNQALTPHRARSLMNHLATTRRTAEEGVASPGRRVGR